MTEQKPEYVHRVIVDLSKPTKILDEGIVAILSAELHYIDENGNRQPCGFCLADVYRWKDKINNG